MPLSAAVARPIHSRDSTCSDSTWAPMLKKEVYVTERTVLTCKTKWYSKRTTCRPTATVWPMDKRPYEHPPTTPLSTEKYSAFREFHSVSRNPPYEATCTSHRIACRSTFSEPAGGRGKRRTIAGPICRISPSSEFSDRTAFAFYTFGIGAKKLRNPERNGASFLKCPKSKAEVRERSS